MVHSPHGPSCLADTRVQTGSPTFCCKVHPYIRISASTRSPSCRSPLTGFDVLGSHFSSTRPVCRSQLHSNPRSFAMGELCRSSLGPCWWSWPSSCPRLWLQQLDSLDLRFDVTGPQTVWPVSLGNIITLLRSSGTTAKGYCLCCRFNVIISCPVTLQNFAKIGWPFKHCMTKP